jgi:hypothetical protein
MKLHDLEEFDRRFDAPLLHGLLKCRYGFWHKRL